MALKTPPLHAKGVYALKAPWAAPANVTYECIAIRSFADFTEAGHNAYTAIYVPNNLTLADYEADKAAGANIITLASKTHPTILVPDTYIDAYPSIGNVAYKMVVLSVALGPIPDTTDLTFLKDQMAGTVSDVIGVVPQVNLHVAPSTGVITPEAHTTLETARQAAITNRTTDRAKIIELQNTVDKQKQQLAEYEKILRENGHLPA